MKATWKGTTLAESKDTLVIEGNHYFPPDSVGRQYMLDSSTRTVCPWKGEASYYNVSVGDDTLKDGAWYYPEAKEAAKQIEGYVAFLKNVEVVP